MPETATGLSWGGRPISSFNLKHLFPDRTNVLLLSLSGAACSTPSIVLILCQSYGFMFMLWLYIYLIYLNGCHGFNCTIMRGRFLWCGEVCMSLRHLIKYSCSCKTISSRCLTSDLIRQLVRHLCWFSFRVYIRKWLLRIKEWPNSCLFWSKANCGRCCSLSTISSVTIVVPTVAAAVYAAAATAYTVAAAAYAVTAAA